MNCFLKHIIQRLAIVLILLVAAGNSYGQLNTKTRILFVLDGSQSMLGTWGSEQKMKVATRLLSELMDSLKTIPSIEVALRVYGHQHAVATGNRSCEDTRLEVPFGYNNYDQIKTKLTQLRPKGTTPIAYSLEQTKNDFPSCGNCRNIIILITDGIEECDGDPCAVALALQKNQITLKPFVIGMGLDLKTIEAFKCVGSFFEAKDQASFRNVLDIVISQALNNTTVQVNLIDANGDASETDVNMTFYDNHSHAIKYNFIHTLNSRGLPDTLPIDPVLNYDLTAHTIPPVSKNNIEITPGRHNIIALDAPQGMLQLKMNGLNEYDDLKVVVRKSGEMKTLHVQSFEETTKYITGNYDLEILTLPRMHVNDVNIAQSHTTKVFIPEPGIVTLFLTGRTVTEIFVEENNELQFVYKLSPSTSRETIVLQPGKYRVVSRGINVKEAVYTKEKTFQIVSGASTQVKF